MRRLPSGNWSIEINRKALQREGFSRRWQLSLETTNKRDAARRRTLILHIIDQGHTELIDAIRSGALSIIDVDRRVSRGDSLESLVPGEKGVTLETIRDLYVASKSARAQGTIKIATYYLDTLLDNLGAEKVATDVSITQAFAFLHRDTWSPNSRREARKHLIAAWKVAQLPSNVWKDVDPGRAEKNRIRVLTDAEWQRLAESATGTPHYAAFVLAFICGLRAGEILNLRRNIDVDLEARLLSIQNRPGWNTKTIRSIRTIPFGEVVAEAIQAHIASDFAGRTYIFRAARNPFARMPWSVLDRALKRHLRRCRIMGVTLHTGRHTAITNALSRGVPLSAAAHYFGDSEETLLSTYSHLVEGSLKGVSDALNPQKATHAPSKLLRNS